ncbi:hypothetical protein [Rhizobium leguminosarum]|nr:hypothetical protein [Rhizobium leguminosarum]
MSLIKSQGACSPISGWLHAMRDLAMEAIVIADTSPTTSPEV